MRILWWQKYSIETVPYGNAKSTTIGNPNFILYGMHKKREKFYINNIEKKKPQGRDLSHRQP